MTRFYTLAAGIAMVTFLAVMGTMIVMGRLADRGHDCDTTAVAGGSIGGPFELMHHNGTLVTEADVITKPTLIYFGYTFCPDVCPIDTVRNADVVDLLAEDGVDVTPVFITIDPERDTPEVLAEFSDLVHPDMIGLTGTPAQIKTAAKAYRTVYSREDTDNEYYLMSHMSFTYLMTPEDGFVTFFRRDVPAETMAETVACYVT